ncbi:translesion DNA synthesis-associated protein ImuA [Aestuariirhabdus sp. LZHN29]|uniref:translesion DNA synthesis-associated protein ImuA n=1 Tax=Aestuariirhabdus sp. LZHN29 TaxID=3417462 RepID=UPI003CF24605
MQFNNKSGLEVWRASEWQQFIPDAVSSGHGVLDDELPGGGWPQGAVTDLLYERDGIGELRILLPALARLSRQQERWVLWVAPPAIPYAPALQAAGVDLSRVLVVRADSLKDRLWAIEQALAGGECSAVLGWPGDIAAGELRRLQLAARKGNSLCFLLRDSIYAQQSAVAALRVKLSADLQGVGVEILKRRGGWPVSRFVVGLDSPAPESGLPAETAAEVIRGPWAETSPVRVQ